MTLTVTQEAVGSMCPLLSCSLLALVEVPSVLTCALGGLVFVEELNLYISQTPN